MQCGHCASEELVKNGLSRHGRQRWSCQTCRRTCGEKDRRRVEPAKREAALAHYLEGVGLRATERLVGVSHNAVMNWVMEAVSGQVLAQVLPEEVEWVEADELGTYIGKKKKLAGCGGLLIVPTKKICGWALGDRSTVTAQRLDAQLPHAAHIKFCTDFWHPYGQIFAHPPASPRQSPHVHDRELQ